MSAWGAREANTSVVFRAFRWATCATWSATKEQPQHACSGLAALRVRRARRRRGRRSADGGRRTGRAGSPRRSARRTRTPCSTGQPRHPPTLGGQRVTGVGQLLLLDEQLPARQLPTPPATRSGVCSWRTPIARSGRSTRRSLRRPFEICDERHRAMPTSTPPGDDERHQPFLDVVSPRHARASRRTGRVGTGIAAGCRDRQPLEVVRPAAAVILDRVGRKAAVHEAHPRLVAFGMQRDLHASWSRAGSDGPSPPSRT